MHVRTAYIIFCLVLCLFAHLPKTRCRWQENEVCGDLFTIYLQLQSLTEEQEELTLAQDIVIRIGYFPVIPGR